MARESSEDSEVSSLSEVSRHVLNLERRLTRLETLIHILSDRLGQLEERCRIAESHFESTARLAQEARYQAALGRIEVDQLAHRVQACEQRLDLAALD